MPIDDPPDPGAAFVRRLVSRLRLRQLALLLAIERLRTLSRVASEMRLSQPATSKALREVEDTFAAPPPSGMVSSGCGVTDPRSASLAGLAVAAGLLVRRRR